MNKIITSFVITCMLSCTETTTELSKDIVPEDKMVEIMVDLQLIEGIIAVRDTDPEEVNAYYQSIFDKYQINREVLDKNIQHYSEHPEILESIYQEVITELSKKQAKVENEAQ